MRLGAFATVAEERGFLKLLPCAQAHNSTAVLLRRQFAVIRRRNGSHRKLKRLRPAGPAGKLRQLSRFARRGSRRRGVFQAQSMTRHLQLIEDLQRFRQLLFALRGGATATRRGAAASWAQARKFARPLKQLFGRSADALTNFFARDRSAPLPKLNCIPRPTSLGR